MLQGLRGLKRRFQSFVSPKKTSQTPHVKKIKIDPQAKKPTFDDLLETLYQLQQARGLIPTLQINSHKSLASALIDVSDGKENQKIFFEALLSLCRQNKSIEKLELSGNHLWAAVKTLPHAIRALEVTKITSIDLSRNGFGRHHSDLKHFIATARAICESPLVEADLSENELTNIHAIALLKELPKVNGQVIINLNGNKLSRNLEAIIEGTEPDLFDAIEAMLVSSKCSIILTDPKMEGQTFLRFLAAVTKFRMNPSFASSQSEMLPVLVNCVISKRDTISQLLSELPESVYASIKPLQEKLAKAITLGDIINCLTAIDVRLTLIAPDDKLTLQHIKDVKSLLEIYSKSVELFLGTPVNASVNALAKVMLPKNAIKLKESTPTEPQTRVRSDARATSPSPRLVNR